MLASKPKKTRKCFQKAQFARLQSKRARKKHSHPLLKNSKLTLAEFDHEDSVRQPYSSDERKKYCSCVQGVWLAQTELMVGRERFFIVQIQKMEYL